MTRNDAPPTTPPRGFPQAEFEMRTARAQALMAAREIDALLLTTEPELRYFSGFRSQFWESPTRPWFLVVPRQGRPIAVIPEIGAAGMAATWIEDIRSWPAPEPEDDGVSLLAATLTEQASRWGRIGVPLGHQTHLRMPAADYARLVERLGNLEVADATGILRTLRDLKSSLEIDKIRYVCGLTSDAFEALPAAARIGDSERQVCRKLQLDMLRRGADATPYLIGASGPGGYDNIIMGPTDRSLEAGDVLIIDTGATFDGYFCDFDRNFAFGPASEEARRAFDVVYRATEAGIDAARPGATHRRPHRAGARHGDHHRAGHGLRAGQADGARGEHRHHRRPGRVALASCPTGNAGDFMSLSSARYRLVLVLLFLALWIPLAIEPFNREDWLLENLLVFVFAALLILSFKRLPFSGLSYTLIFLFLCLHAVGAHYTYSEVPYDAWVRGLTGGSLNQAMGWERNHFDRLVHFSYGLLLAYPIREVFLRVVDARGFWGYFLPLDVTMSTSMFYELIEWAVAEVIVGSELGMAYLGTQGDVWDAHKDMALASLGALIAMALAMAVNMVLQRDFAREFRDSLRVKHTEPLGENKIGRMRRGED
jgi:Xaa-Pro aminopeptidase/uncharacterized membrane protein YjdF